MIDDPATGFFTLASGTLPGPRLARTNFWSGFHDKHGISHVAIRFRQ